MKKVAQGDTVTIDFVGMIEGGEIVESSAKTGAFDLEVGKGLMPAGFENALIGMQVGEEKTVVLEPEDAYGRFDEDLLHTIKKSALGKDIHPKPGMVLGMTVDKEGRKHKVPALVTAVSGGEITIDFNHPLAGKAITYRLTVKAVK